MPEPDGPDDREQLALLDRERDAVQRLDRAGARVGLRDVLELEHGAHAGTTTWSPTRTAPLVIATRSVESLNSPVVTGTVTCAPARTTSTA